MPVMYYTLKLSGNSGWIMAAAEKKQKA